MADFVVFSDCPSSDTEDPTKNMTPIEKIRYYLKGITILLLAFLPVSSAFYYFIAGHLNNNPSYKYNSNDPVAIHLKIC